MDKRYIQIGDLVDVCMSGDIPDIWSVRVLSTPQGEGDCWSLYDEALNLPYNVQRFEVMTLVDRRK